MPFVAYTQGGNAIVPYCHSKDGTVRLNGGCFPGKTPLTVATDDDDCGSIALFHTRAAALDAARACHWNGQTFGTKVAWPSAVATGVFVEVDEWVSCQEIYSR